MYRNAGERAATIADVANLAGVSQAAVSKVIRNAYGVSPAMKSKVRAAIEQLHYRPRVAARAMRGSSFTLGIELPSLHNQFLAEILDGASSAIAGTGYQLLVAPTRTNDDAVNAIETLMDQQVDGILTIAPLVSTGWLERVAERVPLVTLGLHTRSNSFDCVVGDDIHGTQLAMEHLFQLGHRKIAHLTRAEQVTDARTGTTHAVRLAEYQSFMRAHDLADEVRVIRASEADHSGADVVGAALKNQYASAIFAGDDDLAIGALQATRNPGTDWASVAVVGYDNAAIAGHPLVGLTTVDQDAHRMGRTAIELLTERIAGRTEARTEVIPVKLIERSTSRVGR
ncbi:LacI family DNA-binding transcriptional regulator [Agromyces albus]|uniref:LacI family DNA-binding transcriptional regulator n=1 Tax=Agromyces albus TaxID=205332 RepID=UPI00277ECF9F|nr:LacI family DNA-binding transcriptional regulator [Agromyces albus]MDQ0577226.1 LacI family transcriptional regulator [Agromyces albus]